MARRGRRCHFTEGRDSNLLKVAKVWPGLREASTRSRRDQGAISVGIGLTWRGASIPPLAGGRNARLSSDGRRGSACALHRRREVSNDPPRDSASIGTKKIL